MGDHVNGDRYTPNIPKSQGGHYVPASSMVWEVSNILPLGLPPAPKEEKMIDLWGNVNPHIQHSIALLREHEPPEGYYLAFSGGKDSIVCYYGIHDETCNSLKLWRA